MRYSRLALLAAMTSLAAKAQTPDDEPSLRFLEYLGSWQEGDEEWLIVAEMEREIVARDETANEDEETGKTQDTGKSNETDDQK